MTQIINLMNGDKFQSLNQASESLGVTEKVMDRILNNGDVLDVACPVEYKDCIGNRDCFAWREDSGKVWCDALRVCTCLLTKNCPFYKKDEENKDGIL